MHFADKKNALKMLVKCKRQGHNEHTKDRQQQKNSRQRVKCQL